MSWHARLLLLSPARVQRSLDRVQAAELVPTTPTVWQIELGVLRMWHRTVFRSETIGTSVGNALRPGWRARLMLFRPLRFPFLLKERAVAPWDPSGLLSSPDRLICHLLGAHHDGVQFLYDLQMLQTEPGALERLRDQTAEVVNTNSPRSRWLRDLCAYEGYHERLLKGVNDFLAGSLAPPPSQSNDPDICFLAYLRWCADQPTSASDTWRAWRQGRFHPQHGLLPS